MELLRCLLLHRHHDGYHRIRWSRTTHSRREDTHDGICYILCATFSLYDDTRLPVAIPAYPRGRCPSRKRYQRRRKRCRSAPRWDAEKEENHSEEIVSSLHISSLFIILYSPHEIALFLDSKDFRSVIGKSFYKRHMESDDIVSPFDTPEEIYLLEYLIREWYIIAEYRSEAGKDNESYLLSTFGHAFIRNYGHSPSFRFRANLIYWKDIYWMLFASFVGSIFANLLFLYFL